MCRNSSIDVVFAVQSCDPNLKVQAVLNDTRSNMLYRLCLFAAVDVAPSTELTMDVQQLIAPVSGMVEFCHCGSKKCRGRLM